MILRTNGDDMDGCDENMTNKLWTLVVIRNTPVRLQAGGGRSVGTHEHVLTATNIAGRCSAYIWILSHITGGVDGRPLSPLRLCGHEGTDVLEPVVYWQDNAVAVNDSSCYYGVLSTDGYKTSCFHHGNGPGASVMGSVFQSDGGREMHANVARSSGTDDRMDGCEGDNG